LSATAFDILVIGAGPAGIISSLHAADSGIQLSVGLIDRKKEPGVPVRCGEGIGLKGFSSVISIDKKWIISKPVKARLVSPSGIAVTLPGEFENYIIDRERMEGDLVAEAVSRGVVFIPDTTVVSVDKNTCGMYECHDNSGKIFTGKCLILADGVESKMARCLGWKTVLAPSEIMSCAFTRLEHPSIKRDVCDFFMGQSIAPGGYAWVFPRGENGANVGVGVVGSLCRPGMPLELLHRFIAKQFPGAGMSELHCGSVPIGPWLKPLSKEGVMVVGDAARQVNCVSGAGLAYSFFSGKVAGLAAAEAFKGPTPGVCNLSVLKNYEKQWASHYGKQQKRSHVLKKTINGFNDTFLDDIARSLEKTDPQSMKVSRVFIKAFSKHPLHLLKVLKLFK
jgi:digeranylgeranylglycerophospholipid reductase